jgi:Pentapeptide repeats (8 copies)
MVDVEKIEIRNRWTNKVQFTAEIICAPDATLGVKIGLAVRWGRDNGADLSDAVLRDADLSDAVLRGAVLRGAALRDADLSDAVLRDADLRGAVLSGADLSGAVLRGADLRGAVLRGAVLRGADLRGAVLSGADLSGAVLSDAVLRDAPIIPNIHQAVYAAVTAPGHTLDMRDWHDGGNFCGTTHCRAGWVTHLAGKAGRELERKAGGTAAAATLIYLASDPKLERIPDFYNATDAEALADMKRLAEQES